MKILTALILSLPQSSSAISSEPICTQISCLLEVMQNTDPKQAVNAYGGHELDFARMNRQTKAEQTAVIDALHVRYLDGQGSAFDKKGFQSACPAETKLDLLPEDIAEIEYSADLKSPAKGRISAGTWSYSDGSLHLGMDLAVPLYTPLKAPANGVVLYADAPSGDSSGWLGCSQGYPARAGNSMLLLCETLQGVYAVSYFHLSSQLFAAPGSIVGSDAIIALSGNSGNSSGPHVHIEVFELFCTFEQAASWFSRTADFSFGCGWSSSEASSAIGRRIRPETALVLD